MQRHGGAFPRDVASLAALPGIGRSTAAAIAAFAYGTRAAILDGNVKRVIARHRAIEGYPGTSAVERALWSVAESLLPAEAIEPYTQGLMDLVLERRGRSLVFLLRDYADACNPAQLKPKRPSGKRVGGLGLHFIDTIMDHWEHRKPADGRGNLLVMSKRID